MTLRRGSDIADYRIRRTFSKCDGGAWEKHQVSASVSGSSLAVDGTAPYSGDLAFVLVSRAMRRINTTTPAPPAVLVNLGADHYAQHLNAVQ